MTDKTYWFPDDKAWMAERKAQWRQVKFNLDVLSTYYPPFKRKFHKQHQELFFRGELKLTKYRENFINQVPIFTIWYHPEAETLDLRQLFLDSLSGGSADINSRRRFFFHEFCMGNGPGMKMYPPDYGMMGGREALCVDYLFPGLDYKESILDEAGKKHPASMYPDEIRRYCQFDTLRELYMDARFSPYSPGQYLWDHVSYAMEHYPEELFAYNKARQHSEKYRNSFLTLLAEILSFEQRTDPSRHRPSTSTMVERLITQYEQKIFSDAMLKHWDEAKKNIKKLKQEHAIKFFREPEFLAEQQGGTFPVELQEERIAQWEQV